MVIETKEILSLAPLTSIAFSLWLRDKFIYNRVRTRWFRSTATQARVLGFIWPIWIFLGWTLGMQVNRGHVGAAFLTTTGQHIAGYYSTIGILNDSFYMSRQQLYGFFIGLGLSYLWTIFWLTVTTTSDVKYVHRVERHNCSCGEG